VEVQRPDGDREELPYDRLLLGTGAVSIQPKLPGADLPGVFALRWMGDTLELAGFIEQHQPQRALIIGGGYIGMEMSEALTRRGLQVTVVEAMPSVMTTLDADLGERVAAELRRNGVDVVSDTRIERIEQDAMGSGSSAPAAWISRRIWC
jgi:NADPH-dependent 2,4-dienoyl-CoA reductase/sulfur reductase-like enzyme